jgi:biopolymer transport protein TolR
MAGFSSGGSGKKDLNFELNLLPVFDILSVCICFLLMSVVWVQVGALQVTQAVGGQSAAETKNPPAVWITLNNSNDIEFTMKDSSKVISEKKIKAEANQINWNVVNAAISNVAQAGLVKVALIMPSGRSNYADMIRLMDEFKRVGIKDVGLSPL